MTGNGEHGVPPRDVYDEVRAERRRAHEKHGDTSMESFPVDDMNRLAILTEEVGEVAKEFNEARHEDRPVDVGRLRWELIQTATMAVAWADAIGKQFPSCEDLCIEKCIGVCGV